MKNSASTTNNIVLLPGKSFTKKELLKRLNIMGIECNANMGPKSFYDKLYDRSVSSNDNQQKIMNLLLMDTQRSSTVKRASTENAQSVPFNPTLPQKEKVPFIMETNTQNWFNGNTNTNKESDVGFQMKEQNRNVFDIKGEVEQEEKVEKNPWGNNEEIIDTMIRPKESIGIDKYQSEAITDNMFTSIPKRNVNNADIINTNPFLFNSQNDSKKQNNIYENNEYQTMQFNTGRASYKDNNPQLEYNQNEVIPSKRQSTNKYTIHSVNPVMNQPTNQNTIPVREFDVKEEEQQPIIDNDDFSSPMKRNAHLNTLYLGGFAFLGLITIFVIIYAVVKRQLPPFVTLLNPVTLLRDYLIPSLGRWGRRIFKDYIFVTISVLAVAAISIVIYMKKNKHAVTTKIFEDIKTTLKNAEEQNNYEGETELRSGMAESEIVSQYSNEYGISREVFEKEYMPILRDMRRRDEHLKIYDDFYQGRKQIFWQWSK